MIPYPAITLNVPFILSFRKFGVEFSFLVEFFPLSFDGCGEKGSLG